MNGILTSTYDGIKGPEQMALGHQQGSSGANSLELRNSQEDGVGASGNVAHRGTTAVPGVDDNKQALGIWHQLGTVAVELAQPEVAFGCLHRHLSSHPYDVLALLLAVDACTRFESLHQLVDWDLVADDVSISTRPCGTLKVPGYENCSWVASLLHQCLQALGAASGTSDDARAAELAVRMAWCKLQYNMAQYAAVVAQVDEILALSLVHGAVELTQQQLIYLKCLNLMKLRQYNEAGEMAALLRPSSAATTTNYHQLMVKLRYAAEDYHDAARHLAVLAENGRPPMAPFNYRYQILMAHRENRPELAANLCLSALVLFPTDYALLVLRCYGDAAAATTAISNGMSAAAPLATASAVLDHLYRYFPLASYDFVPFYLQSWTYFLAGRYSEAYQLLQHCLACTSKITLVWVMVGRLYLELGQLPDALSAYSQAIRLADESSVDAALAWDGLGCVYTRSEGQAGDAADARAMAVKSFRAGGWLLFAALYGEGSEHAVPVPVPLLVVLTYVEMDVADRVALCESLSRA